MKTFVEKQNQRQQKPSAILAKQNTRASTAHHELHPLLHLQRTIGNQAVLRLLQAGNAPRVLARQPADVEEDKPKPPPKTRQCKTGCSMRWGQDTTCSKWGFVESVHETGEGKKWRSFPCCNSWPLSIETYARNQGLNGAASCPVQHQKKIATVSLGEKEVEVLCSDTIPNDMGGETTNARACSGRIEKEVIEMSPKAMQDLSGQVTNPLHVKVCFSGSKQDLCLHNGPGAGRFPTINQCLTKGCSPADGPLDHEKSGWPRR